jgi:small subunit ribosomal protein S3
MGHKVNPVGFRLGVIRNWDAKWYADKHFVTYLQEDLKVRKAIKDLYPEAGVSQVEIDRQANNVTLTIHTARPGILIGRGGQRVDDMRKMLEKLIGKKVQLNIREIQQPELDAFLVARNVADQMERRVSYRRAMKQTMQRTIQAGAKGMRIRCAGRLDGAEIARKIIMHEGRVPLHTIRADIDYGFTEARTVMGRIGVKVWLYKGEILPEKEEVTVAAPVVAETESTVATAMAEALASAANAPAEAVKAEAEKPKTVRRSPRAKTTHEVETPKTEETPATEAKAKPVRKTVHHTKPAAETPAESTVSAEEKSKAPARKPRTTVAKAKEVKDSAEQGDSNATT